MMVGWWLVDGFYYPLHWALSESIMRISFLTNQSLAQYRMLKVLNKSRINNRIYIYNIYIYTYHIYIYTLYTYIYIYYVCVFLIRYVIECIYIYTHLYTPNLTTFSVVRWGDFRLWTNIYGLNWDHPTFSTSHKNLASRFSAAALPYSPFVTGEQGQGEAMAQEQQQQLQSCMKDSSATRQHEGEAMGTLYELYAVAGLPEMADHRVISPYSDRRLRAWGC